MANRHIFSFFFFFTETSILRISYFPPCKLEVSFKKYLWFSNYGAWGIKWFSFTCPFALSPCQVSPQSNEFGHIGFIYHRSFFYLFFIHPPSVLLPILYISVNRLSAIRLNFFSLNHLTINADLTTAEKRNPRRLKMGQGAFHPALGKVHVRWGRKSWPPPWDRRVNPSREATTKMWLFLQSPWNALGLN